MKASWTKKTFHFKFRAKTSREVLTQKHSWFLVLERDGQRGIGECSIIESLNPETPAQIESKLNEICDAWNSTKLFAEDLSSLPSVQFGFEMAKQDLKNSEIGILFPSGFTAGKSGIPINGLVWMADLESMSNQIEEKLEAGFDCIKLKIGAHETQEELDLLRALREKHPSSQIEIRVDANGAFDLEKAKWALDELAKLEVHSIEQPIRQGQWKSMGELCKNTPVPIALDEELIGVTEENERRELLKEIKPQYLILKPSLIGGFEQADEWIKLAEKVDAGWWATSALESNIGLNAIAQWVFTKNSEMPQGLGTGQLYTDNIPSPLTIEKGHLLYQPTSSWDLTTFDKATSHVD
ncbi:o-succinylbenzoate synthase [Halocola ammonii]